MVAFTNLLPSPIRTPQTWPAALRRSRIVILIADYALKRLDESPRRKELAEESGVNGVGSLCSASFALVPDWRLSAWECH